LIITEGPFEFYFAEIFHIITPDSVIFILSQKKHEGKTADYSTVLKKYLLN